MLRSTCSGRAFNPYTADDPHLAIDIHRAVSPIRVDIDVADLVQEAVELENEHSLEDDLDDLDDVYIMPECDPPAPRVSPPMTDSKRAAGSSTAEEPGLLVPRRHRKRRLAREGQYSEGGHQPSARTMKRIRETASTIYTNLQTEALPAAKGAYSALNVKIPEPEQEREYSAEELLVMGFREIPWEGG